MKVIYVIGVFDLFHRGHVELLRRSREMGDRLVVAINSDRLVTEYKRPPIYSERDRLAIVQSCRYVDEAFIIDTYDNREVVQKYGIGAIVHGDDWGRDSYLQQIRLSEEFLVENGVELLFVPYTGGVSTSDIIRTIKQNDL